MSKNEYVYLNDVEKEELAKFVENQTLFNAVKKVILEPAYCQGKLEPGKDPRANYNFFMAQMSQPQVDGSPTEIYALHAKSLVKAVQIIEDVFKNFEDFRVVKSEEKETKNRGR